MNNYKNYLTIVVPAFKPLFLKEALHSIESQTDKRFDVIVFDDAGPDCIKELCLNYPEFKYIRFNQNLGGSNLIKHWNRCLNLVDSKWVWIFSDDDIMQPNCVKEFYGAIEKNPSANLFQFRVLETNESLETIKSNDITESMDSKKFIHSRFKSRYISCVPDHIFNWEILQKLNGGFVEFPLAWNSDDATWLLLSKETPFEKIQTATVLWRQSSTNISSQKQNSKIKFLADIEYLKWLKINKFSFSNYCATVWLASRISNSYKLKTNTRLTLLTEIPLEFTPAVIASFVYRIFYTLKNLVNKINHEKT